MNYKINEFDLPDTDTASNIFEYNFDEHGPVAAGQVYPSYYGEDAISFDDLCQDEVGVVVPDLPTTNNNNKRWKYNEDVILKEVRDYLGMTYRSHYTSKESKTQTLDLIEGIGDAEPVSYTHLTLPTKRIV